MNVIEEALVEVEQGNTEKGLQLLKSYESQASDDEKFTIGQLYNQWGLVNQSKGIFEELLTKYPDESELKLYLAEIYIDIEEDQVALDLLNQITEEDDQYIAALLLSADLYQSQGLYEVAERKLILAKQFVPSEPIIDFALGELAYATAEYKKSIPYYEKASKYQHVYNDVDVTLRLAEALAATGKWEDALEYFKASNVDSPDFLFRYGFTAYRSERTDIAVSVWGKLLEADPHYHSVYLLLAKAYEQEGLMDEAFETVEKGIKMDEFNKELYYYAGQLALKLGRTEKSLSYMKEAIAIDPGYKEAVISLVDIYKKEEMYDEVKDLINELFRFGEEDPLYYWELARANYETEEYNLALNNYNEAYNAFTDDSDFLKEYGYFLVEEGRMEKAHQVLAQYLEIEPSDTEVEEFLHRISQ
ncbi:tetratricopeptide (TPR) repeat protein [Salirhabdus euzebyi]|uniref:Tetratricopeptide (TPR) repeat protein n=1 Tax=Salirhabdus euzebyi TaxID=394506 RepID=A0A841PWH9_9BACI|nr:tetratricopeptide repeat protein [Salirhabdus euzebyi]MBB6452214.1 tetratricopeptide (TPR) repeat protein [Salirhabdus euzebyi]